MTIVVRSLRIRAYPKAAQQRLLDRWFGARRWLWNTALAIRAASMLPRYRGNLENLLRQIQEQ